mmetsp:Transcript_37012/g.56752  ORF Transcript_37012/g.56752 Transcript_37012/m.56752 type:complete len:169 (+) Transcript_37012:1449-1955(+)
MYNKVNVENTQGDDEPMDIAGYLGKTEYYRERVKMVPFKDAELLHAMYKDNKMKDIMLLIKQIDKDHNGYVTSTELDDILKLKYPKELKNKDLIPILTQFSSIQNRILIDYKKFRDWVLKGQEKLRSQDEAKEQRINLLQAKKQIQKEMISEKMHAMRRSSSMNRSMD